MEREFWLSRWHTGRIGFHQPGGHSGLVRHWPALNIASSARVLVPLCGKTPDMHWLAGRGHPVTGIEFSRRAAVDFFAEHDMTPRIDTHGAFERFHDGDITLLVGDFFDAQARELGCFDAFYDRAALIALPESRRGAYLRHLCTLLDAQARGLLITLEYDQSEMQGPPFSVTEAELHAHLDARFRITRVEDRDELAGGGILSRNNVSAARECVWRLGPR